MQRLFWILLAVVVAACSDEETHQTTWGNGTVGQFIVRDSAIVRLLSMELNDDHETSAQGGIFYDYEEENLAFYDFYGDIFVVKYDPITVTFSDVDSIYTRLIKFSNFRFNEQGYIESCNRYFSETDSAILVVEDEVLTVVYDSLCTHMEALSLVGKLERTVRVTGEKTTFDQQKDVVLSWEGERLLSAKYTKAIVDSTTTWRNYEYQYVSPTINKSRQFSPCIELGFENASKGLLYLGCFGQGPDCHPTNRTDTDSEGGTDSWDLRFRLNADSSLYTSRHQIGNRFYDVTQYNYEE